MHSRTTPSRANHAKTVLNSPSNLVQLSPAVTWAISSVDRSLSGPKDMGKSCSSVMTVYLPVLSYINMGVLGCRVADRSSQQDGFPSLHAGRRVRRRFLSLLRKDSGERKKRTSQNSLINCLHMPQGLAGGVMSVATAMARKSPGFAPWFETRRT